MILSAAMMLEWLGDRHNLQPCRDAADLLDSAVVAAFGAGEVHPMETGGPHGLSDIVTAIRDALPF